MQNPKLRYFEPFELFDHTGFVWDSCESFLAYLAANPISEEPTAIVRTANYLVDSERGGVVCVECGGWYGSIAGWKAHIARERCKARGDTGSLR